MLPTPRVISVVARGDDHLDLGEIHGSVGVLLLAEHEATASGVVGDRVDDLPDAAVVAEVDDLEGRGDVVDRSRDLLRVGLEDVGLQDEGHLGLDEQTVVPRRGQHDARFEDHVVVDDPVVGLEHPDPLLHERVRQADLAADPAHGQLAFAQLTRTPRRSRTPTSRSCSGRRGLT